METPRSAGARILVVEDDPTVAEVVARYLELEGFAVDSVGTGPDAVERAAARPPDLVILDLMLPGLAGFEVLRRLRADGSLPIVILTARGEEDDRVLGLRTGADDYVTKPFSPRELTARVHALLRRARPGQSLEEERSELTAGGLRVDVPARVAWRDGDVIPLTPLEYDLLVFLMRHPGRAFSREQLFEQVWGYSFGDLSTVTVHVRRVREKIEDDPSRPRWLKTVWGVGYRFDA
ncbi:MAG: response regulator transcription factor [Actinomycetota bacterium]|nr:response regulator transcription factor [Actinomycetota bacterium]